MGLLARLFLTGLLATSAGCAPSAVASPTPQPTVPAVTPSPVPTPTPVPASPTAAATLPGQIDTAWGRIWEAVPSTFPRFPGSTTTEIGLTDASAQWVVSAGIANTATVVDFYRTTLGANSAVSVDGPLEDGGYVITAVGTAGCQAEVAIVPLGDITTITVKYGAACPFA